MSNNFDTAIASELIAPTVERLRALPYSELKEKVTRGDIETGDIKAPNGESYQFELLFYWDDGPEGNVRVIASIFMNPRGPNVNDSFIKASDGSFVGENNAT
jgi:hypothetical protein